MQRYYLDTSIWLDLFEDRNEPNFPKSDWAEKLLEKIIKEDSDIVFSDVIKDELIKQGHGKEEIRELTNSIRKIFIMVEVTDKQFKRAKESEIEILLKVFIQFTDWLSKKSMNHWQ